MSNRPAFAVEVAGRARRDIADIVRWTLQHFGHAAAARYAALIRQSLRDIAAEPQLPGAKLRTELADGVYTYHLAYSRDRSTEGRVKEPRHFLVYRVASSRLEVLRVLHDSRDLARNLPAESSV